MSLDIVIRKTLACGVQDIAKFNLWPSISGHFVYNFGYKCPSLTSETHFWIKRLSHWRLVCLWFKCYYFPIQQLHLPLSVLVSNKSFLNFCHPLYLHLFYLTNGQWFWYLLDCTDNNIGHHINQNVVKSVGCTLWLWNILTTVNVVVDKSTDHAKPLSICFFYHNIEVILSDSLTAWLLCDMLTWAALSVLLLTFTLLTANW